MRRKALISGIGIIFTTLFMIVGISVAYASITSKLDINGYASMNNGRWNVHFDNLSNVSIIGSALEKHKPLLNSSATSISGFDIEFFQPKDVVSYTFDVVNEGDFDAEISSITILKPRCNGKGKNSDEDAKMVCENLKYQLKYGDGSSINVEDELNRKSTKKMMLTLEYTGKNLPEEQVEITDLGITIIYSQR